MAQWLRIWHCHYRGSDSVLGPGTSACCECCQKNHGGPTVAQQVENPTSIREGAGLIPGPAQWVKGPVLP